MPQILPQGFLDAYQYQTPDAQRSLLEQQTNLGNQLRALKPPTVRPPAPLPTPPSPPSSPNNLGDLLRFVTGDKGKPHLRLDTRSTPTDKGDFSAFSQGFMQSLGDLFRRITAEQKPPQPDRPPSEGFSTPTPGSLGELLRMLKGEGVGQPDNVQLPIPAPSTLAESEALRSDILSLLTRTGQLAQQGIASQGSRALELMKEDAARRGITGPDYERMIARQRLDTAAKVGAIPAQLDQQYAIPFILNRAAQEEQLRRQLQTNVLQAIYQASLGQPAIGILGQSAAAQAGFPVGPSFQQQFNQLIGAAGSAAGGATI